MQSLSTKIGSKNTLMSILTIAFLLFAFGFVAQEVAVGKSLAFDRRVILAFRDPADPSAPIGPAWLLEAARNVTSLGSIVVLAFITLAAAGYLYLARNPTAAWLMLIAVFGGIALNNLLKAADPTNFIPRGPFKPAGRCGRPTLAAICLEANRLPLSRHPQPSIAGPPWHLGAASRDADQSSSAHGHLGRSPRFHRARSPQRRSACRPPR